MINTSNNICMCLESRISPIMFEKDVSEIDQKVQQENEIKWLN